MATEAQIIANRRNAQKSTGPHMQKVLEIRSIAMFLCASVPLWLPVIYAKQTQFPKS
jgi:hypothetical protein